MLPQAKITSIQENSPEKVRTSSLYLVQPTTVQHNDALYALSAENNRLRNEILELTQALKHKEQLLQNFHIREQELKQELFHLLPAKKNN